MPIQRDTFGTILGGLLSIPVAPVAARNITPNQGTQWLARVIVVGSRSVSELVWALIFAVAAASEWSSATLRERVL